MTLLEAPEAVTFLLQAFACGVVIGLLAVIIRVGR